MKPTSSDRHRSVSGTNEERSLKDSPFAGESTEVVDRQGLALEGSRMQVEGGLEQVEDMEEAGRFGGAGRVGSFVTSKFVELKTSAHEAIDSVSEKVRNNPRSAKLATGMAVLALAGGATELSNHSSEKAEAATATTRALSGPVAANLGYVDNATLPLARKFVRALRRAKPSQKDVTKHTSQMYGKSHNNVTNISVSVPAKRGRKGQYVYAADFRGPIKAKNAVTMSIGMYPDRGLEGSYIFNLSRSKYDNPGSSVYNDMHWLQTATYVQNSKFVDSYHDSCTAQGKRGGDFPIMSKPILAAGMRQAGNVLGRATKRRPIQRLKNVFAGMKPAKKC